MLSANYKLESVSVNKGSAMYIHTVARSPIHQDMRSTLMQSLAVLDFYYWLGVKLNSYTFTICTCNSHIQHLLYTPPALCKGATTSQYNYMYILWIHIAYVCMYFA